MKFLYRVAKDIYNRFEGNLRDVTIVFPGKRAGLFFNQYLASIANRPLWSPCYKTLSEMYEELSDLESADHLLLVYHLYAAYCEAGRMEGVLPEGSSESFVAQPLDQFFSWGEVMLNDFDDIDKNLSHAKDIFCNLKELDDLTTFDYLSEDQQKAIERYFGSFEKDSKSKLKEKFLSIWNLLYPIYRRFKERLSASGIGYDGMICRDVTEHCLHGEKFSSEKYIFVGFNVLTATDHRLMMYLKSEGKALFYWDFDTSYINTDKKFEAGRFIVRNLSDFGNAFSSDDSCYSNMQSLKDITYISSPSNNSQMRFAREWLKKNVPSDSHLNETAVVLCHDSLLQGMLHSIPDVPAGAPPYNINVTMGFPICDTAVYSFIMSVLNLQVFGERGNLYWSHSYVTKVLRHPYCVKMSNGLSLAKAESVRKNNQLFIRKDFFDDDELLSTVFSRHTNPRGLVHYLSDLLRRLGSSLFKSKESESDTSDFDVYLNQESVYTAFSITQRLESLFEMVSVSPEFECIRSEEMGMERLVRLLSEIMRRTSIPFHGEPAEGIQILSLLDTRNIDFKQVIILGANDDNLPQNIHQSSFIPYTLREAHGMTTMEARSSLQAYSFYRLLQRAEKVVILYNSSTDGMSSGDMSRYMTQLLVEQDEVFNPSTRIKFESLESHVSSRGLKRLQVSKTPQVIEILKKKYHILLKDGVIINDPNDRKYFSPSAINTYINCPLQFYFKYVAGLKAEDEMSDEVGNDLFGTIFHDSMERLYKPHIGEILSQSTLLRLSNDQSLIRSTVESSFRRHFFNQPEDSTEPLHFNGEQLLNFEVLVKYVQKQLRYDCTLCPLRIEGIEDKSHEMLIDDVCGLTLRLGGIIDRIDTIHIGDPSRERHRIVDYKTSSSSQKSKTSGELFMSDTSKRAYHIFQTFYYADIYTEHSERKVSPALMYIKAASMPDEKAKEDESIVKLNGRAVTDFASDVKSEFHDQLMVLLNEIFSPDLPFIQTTNEHQCGYCDFKDICVRGR